MSFVDDISNCLYSLKKDGPKDSNILEKLALLKYLNPDDFKKYESDVVKYMGLFYKNFEFNREEDLPFYLFDQCIYDLYKQHFTPVQAEIKSKLLDKNYFLFSAPTSSGKSYLLKDLIREAEKDIAIIVPSRALLNEYIRDLKQDLISRQVRNYNVLPFVEQVNKKHTTQNIFVLTPERAFEFFKYNLDVDLFIFDEAQIIDSKDEIRSLKYRSLLKKINVKYPNSRKLFAYPFVENLEEIQKFVFPNENNNNTKYFKYQTVGQLFVEKKQNDKFEVFDRQGNVISTLEEDPVIQVLKRKKSSVLIYCTKAKIYRGEIYDLVEGYLNYCEPVTDNEAKEIIDKIKDKIGVTKSITSKLIEMLKRGVAIHHGALPHTIRYLIESFINKGYAKICVATTTLEQGVNMPFDAVYLYELNSLNTGLRLKNMIGRAGRTTTNATFDYGIIMTRNKTTFINNLNKHVDVDLKSNINVSEDFEELKEAIENDTLDDKLNMPKSIIQKLASDDVFNAMKNIISNLEDYEKDKFENVRNNLEIVYRYQLKNNRELTRNEKAIFTTAIRILLWKYQKQKFSWIVYNRYLMYVKDKENPSSYKFFPIPNQYGSFKNLFEGASEDYYFDLMVYDTYEFIDRCLNLYLNDIFSVATIKYLERVPDDKTASNFLKFLQYGSDVDEEVMLFRYGFVEDEIEKVLPCIESIDDNEIVFNDKVNELDDVLKDKCLYYKYD